MRPPPASSTRTTTLRRPGVDDGVVQQVAHGLAQQGRDGAQARTGMLGARCPAPGRRPRPTGPNRSAMLSSQGGHVDALHVLAAEAGLGVGDVEQGVERWPATVFGLGVGLVQGLAACLASKRVGVGGRTRAPFIRVRGERRSWARLSVTVRMPVISSSIRPSMTFIEAPRSSNTSPLDAPARGRRGRRRRCARRCGRWRGCGCSSRAFRPKPPLPRPRGGRSGSPAPSPGGSRRAGRRGRPGPRPRSGCSRRPAAGPAPATGVAARQSGCTTVRQPASGLSSELTTSAPASIRPLRSLQGVAEAVGGAHARVAVQGRRPGRPSPRRGRRPRNSRAPAPAMAVCWRAMARLAQAVDDHQARRSGRPGPPARADAPARVQGFASRMGVRAFRRGR